MKIAAAADCMGWAQDVVEELRGMACICSDGVSEGLRDMEPGDLETMRAIRAANRAIHLIIDLAKRSAIG